MAAYNGEGGLVTPKTPTYQDPRSFTGIFARGRNNYNGSFAPPGAGRPPNIDLSAAMQRRVGMPQGAEGGNPIGNAYTEALIRRIHGSGAS